MQVFYDTEFTSGDMKSGQPYLISIGCVAQNGRDEFYSELVDTYHEGLCSGWVKQNVLPLLQGGECRMREAELALRLKEWVEGLTDKGVIFRSDYPGVDWPWVETLFTFYGCWPKNMRRKPGAISFEENRQQLRFNVGLQNFWKVNITRQHHALVDARSLLFAWKFAIRRGI